MIPQLSDDKEQASVEKGVNDFKDSAVNKNLSVSNMSQAE